MRDARISTLYEGTTGVQALDLIGRKILLDKGKELSKQVKLQVSEAARIGTSQTARNHGLLGHSVEIGKLSAQWATTAARVPRNRSTLRCPVDLFLSPTRR